VKLWKKTKTEDNITEVKETGKQNKSTGGTGRRGLAFLKHRKLLVILLVLFLCAIAGFLFLRSKKNQKNPMDQMQQVIETTTVEKMDLANSISVTGTIASASRKTGTTTLSNLEVEEVYVEVGDIVEAGDLICVFDSADIEEALATAKNNYSVNQALENLDGDYTTQYAETVQEAEDTLQHAKDTRDAYKAVYVNAYQIYSQVVQAEYYIDEQIMQAPEITPESGTYTEPQYITINMEEENYQVYYTTDGSEPDMESSLYEGAIPMPIGESRFAFAFFDEAGRPGEIAYAKYNFSPNIAFTGEQASNMLIQTLISQGELADADGHLVGVEGKRQYDPTSVIAVSDIYYYLLEEYFSAPDGTSQKTGNYYAVSSGTGESFRALRNSMGTFELRKIQ